MGGAGARVREGESGPLDFCCKGARSSHGKLSFTLANADHLLQGSRSSSLTGSLASLSPSLSVFSQSLSASHSVLLCGALWVSWIQILGQSSGYPIRPGHVGRPLASSENLHLLGRGRNSLRRGD